MGNLDNPSAKQACRTQFNLALAFGFTGALLAFNEMHGFPRGEVRVGSWLNAMMHLFLISIFWRYRVSLSMAMRGFDPNVTSGEDRAARAYPYFTIVVIAAVWWITNIVVSYGNFDLRITAPHYKTMGILMFAPILDTLIRGLVRHFLPPISGEGKIAEHAYISAKRSHVRVGRVVVFGFVILLMADFWGMSATNLASAGVGPQLAARLI